MQSPGCEVTRQFTQRLKCARTPMKHVSSPLHTNPCREGFDVSNTRIGSLRTVTYWWLRGADFRELSEFTLKLENAPPGSVRKEVTKEVHGERSFFISSSSGEVEWLNDVGVTMRSSLV